MVSINGGLNPGYGTGRTNAKQDNQRLQNEQGFDGCDAVSGSSGSGNVSGAGNVSGTSGTGSVSGFDEDYARLEELRDACRRLDKYIKDMEQEKADLERMLASFRKKYQEGNMEASDYYNRSDKLRNDLTRLSNSLNQYKESYDLHCNARNNLQSKLFGN